ncbi:MAG: DUF3108 domain-containing protein [Burkholderiales bacterium]|nr:DUF3108 domain-containing protein [Burkholderiales bacterium]
MSDQEINTIRRPSLFSIRTAFFVAVTLFLHIWFLQAGDWQHWTPEHSPATQQVRVSLRPDLPKLAAAPSEAAAPKPARKKMTSAAQETTTASKSDKPRIEPTPEPTPEPQPVPEPSPITKDAVAEPTPANTTVTNTSTGIVASNAFTALIPESVEMQMEVTHTKVNGSPTVGVGQLSWDVYNNQYQIKLQVGVNLLFTTINLFSISSEGSVGDAGLMPRLSTDARRNRAETAIHFDHAAGTITLSAGNKTVPLSTGAQDAASLLLQLTAIGNANPAQYRAGNTFEIQVAEGRDVSEFMFNVIGEEEIESKLSETGALKAVHISRPPRPGSYNSRLDIWLAPEKKWFPVQIRNTESNGNVTNQIVTAFKKKIVHENK